jgi:hypothetical protein
MTIVIPTSMSLKPIILVMTPKTLIPMLVTNTSPKKS